jgi:hypothetical protein
LINEIKLAAASIVKPHTIHSSFSYKTQVFETSIWFMVLESLATPVSGKSEGSRDTLSYQSSANNLEGLETERNLTVTSLIPSDNLVAGENVVITWERYW